MNTIYSYDNEQIPKVFMVDDSKTICLQVNRLFSKEHVEFKYSLSAENAISEIEQYKPSVIIQDLYMPHKDGFTLLKEYRSSSVIKEIPVLIFSGECDVNTKHKLLSLGANDFLYKDSDQYELVARVLYYSKKYLNNIRTTHPDTTSSINKLYKVLLVDSSKLSCLMVQKSLSQEENIMFEYCLNINNVIETAEKYSPDMIFLKTFNTNECLDLINNIREHFLIRNTPVIVCSIFDDLGLREAYLKTGANEFIVNSSDNMELISQIKYYSKIWHSYAIKSSAGFSYESINISVRLLMVDDSKFICASIKQLLSSEKYIQITFCNKPLQALELAKQYNPTIVLMDLEMPEISGLELLTIFRNDDFTQEIPVIILSGISDVSVKAKAFALGANDYMEKEMDKIELISRIQYHSKSYLNSIQLNNTINELTYIQNLLKSQSLFIRKTFGRYLSDEIVNSILESPEGMKLGGESRNISIMMTDLRGFTALSENLPAETVLSIINNYLSVMTDLLHKYNGTIDEFIGDAILAIFGAPIARENDAIRAVACAIEMQIAMQRVNQWNRKHDYPDVAMGIGINTGDAVVGNIGSEKRAKYGIVGSNVNLASRIESYTIGGQIYISENTLNECGGVLRIDGEMKVSPKGVNAPITIYEVGGIYGKFNLFLPVDDDELLFLTTPMSIRFKPLDGKNISDELYVGRIISLSKKYAEIQSEFIIECLSNIKIYLIDENNKEICDDIYAKVTKHKGKNFIISFTYINPKAHDFL